MSNETLDPRKPRPALAAAALAVETVPIDSIRPAAVNDEIYKHVRADDPAVRELAESISALGVLGPFPGTTDGAIPNGSRHAAARAAVVAEANNDGLAVVPAARRDGVRAAKRPVLDALKKIVNHKPAFWPLTVRQCYYQMLNTGVLEHAKKSGSK